MNFDALIDRRGRHSMKWREYESRDILPMGLADMDFACAPAILDALKSELDHGVLGYTHADDYLPATEAVQHWLACRYNWQVESEWILWLPGVVPGLNLACQAFCNDAKAVLLPSPNYGPLRAAPLLQKRRRALIGHIQDLDSPGHWHLDWQGFMALARCHPNSLVLLCNPMNPLGSLYRADEMDRVASICEEFDLTLCSDEVHCDLLLAQGARHQPAGAHPGLAQRSITLMSASKTFNLAGLSTAFAIIPNPSLRRRWQRAGRGLLLWPNIMGLVATAAAFTRANDWYAGLLTYLRANRDLLCDGINALPGLSVAPPEGTYLAWVKVNVANKRPQACFEAAGLGSADGRDFGAEDYVRLNFACPRAYIHQALSRLSARLDLG